MTRLRTLLLKMLNSYLLSFFQSKYEGKVFVKPTSKAPMKKRKEDGGFDFYVDLLDSGLSKKISLAPGQVIKLSTGCHCRFPDNTVWQWDVRSSSGLKGLDVTCRTIDCLYTGLLSIVVVNNTNESVNIHHQDRIAQLVPNPFNSKYFFTEVGELSELGSTDRGANGFGSSGR